MVNCENCGSVISEGQEVVLRGKDKRVPFISVCPTCVTEMERLFKEETEDPNLMGASFLGVIAALVASFLWYELVVTTNYRLGIVAVAIGWVVAQAVMLGAGHKRGSQLQTISVGITIMAMGFSEYLVVRHFAIQTLSQEGSKNIPLLLPFDVMIKLIIEGIKVDPLTLLFWGIAVWVAFTLPAPRMVHRVSASATGQAVAPQGE